MQPPLSLGTCLQNRYQLIRILGQGGFGRTYLATDQGRFNERCAIKEWIPPLTTQADFDKSRELFLREASVLYQVKHPQIPQFQANFEQDQRLFLVQDYVEGETYRTLLDQRIPQGQKFQEAEVLQFLVQILPVLGYLHDQGIIHRDISPDNIILRSQDHCPVLIDFGVVKEVVTQLQATGTQMAATTVGKLGYAPSEQMQTGRAYPNSDLYALAVTAIVLLTGREPQDLFDDQGMTWQWQSFTTVQPRVAETLNRMLSFRPNDRYRSAAEVVDVLKTLAVEPQSLGSRSAPPSASTLKTVAVGGRREALSSDDQSQTQQPPIPQKRPEVAAPGRNIIVPQPSLWENPWMFIPMAILVALVSGFAAWMVVGVLLQRHSPGRSSEQTTTPAPTLDPNAPLLSPKAAVPQSVTLLQLPLVPGELAVRDGAITAPLLYRFSATAGQILDFNLIGEGVQLTLLGANQEPVSSFTTQIRRWQGQLPATSNYTLRLSLAKGVDQSDYQLRVTLSDPVTPTTPNPVSTTSPDSTPLATETPNDSVASPAPSPAIIVSTPKPSPPSTPKATVPAVPPEPVPPSQINPTPGEPVNPDQPPVEGKAPGNSGQESGAKTN